MKAALDKFEAGRRMLRKAYFASRDLGNGFTYEWGHEWVLRQKMGLHYSDVSPLAQAVRKQWPQTTAIHWKQIVGRYLDIPNLTEADAVRAVAAGFVWPKDAFESGVISKPDEFNFEGE